MRTHLMIARLAGVSILALAATAPVFAQNATNTLPQDQEEPTDVQDAAVSQYGLEDPIVVTGSRVKRDGFTAPTPETVLSAAELANKSPTNIADAINQLPQLSGSATPRQQTNAVSSGSAGSNFLNLRGLGANRTLVLLDGRRVVGANADGRVDINTLPSTLISRVDIVTGGASAAYGSDAVSGVVNFILDTSFTGFKLGGQTGITTYGDNFKYRLDAAGGFSFADGRGHILVSGSYADAEGVDRADSRPWFDGSKIIPNPARTATNGLPLLILARNANLNASTPGGIITSGTLRGTTFGPGGAIGQFDYGTLTSDIYSLGGPTNDLAAFYSLDVAVKQTNVFARGSYEFTDALKVFAEFIYAKAEALQAAPFNFHNANVTIRNDNAFLPAAVRTQLQAAGQTSFTLGTFNDDLGNRIGRNDRRLTRYVLGLSGDLGAGWSYEAYGQYGETAINTGLSRLELVQNYRDAVDAVRNAAGQIVCRTVLTNPASACVPYNVFGTGVNGQAAADYVTGAGSLDSMLRQKVAAASLQGEPFTTWAGPVSIVVGGEYRQEDIVSTADPISQASGFAAGNYKSSRGEFDVYEAFAETVVPLLRDSALGKSLEFNGAVRRTHYSTSGSVNTWKLGLNYEPISDIRFRVVRSRDIRAPNLADLFQGGVTSSGQTVIDPFRGSVQTTGIIGTLVGNTDLTPEVASTWSGGVVVSPSFVRGLTLSIDYYSIKIENAIATLTLQQVLDRCFAGSIALCSGIQRNAAGVITAMTRRPVNVNSEALKGLDIEGTYRTDLANLSSNLDGRLTLRGLATYTDTRYIDDGRLRDEQAGENSGAVPKWRVNASIGYDDDTFGAVFVARYVSPGVYDKAYTAATLSAADNRIAGATYYDVGLSFKFGDGTRGEFFFNVDNVFNKDPVIVAPVSQQFLTAPINALLYDTLGREFRTGVRLKF